MRYLLVAFSFFAVFFLPWWGFALLVVFGFFFYPRYVEGCVLALLFDATYAGAPLFGVYGVMTIASVLLLGIRVFLVPRLRLDVSLS